MADKQIEAEIQNDNNQSYSLDKTTIEDTNTIAIDNLNDQSFEIGLINLGAINSYIYDSGGYVDDTIDANDPDANDCLLYNECYFGGEEKFDELIINVTTALVGAGVFYTFYYWDGGSWVALNTLPYGNKNFTVAGINKYQMNFNKSLWQKRNDPGGVGYNHYYIWAHKTATAPTTWPLAGQMWLGYYTPFVFPSPKSFPRPPAQLSKTFSRYFARTTYEYRMELPELRRLSYDYKAFSGESNDVYSEWFVFPFESYFIHFQCDTDTILQFMYKDGSISAEMAGKYLYRTLNVMGFRIKNYFSGFNAKYQLVAFR